MRSIYTHFVRQNIAPRGAKCIGVYKDGKRMLNIPLGGLTPPSGDPLYRFGIVSDMHIYPKAAVAWTPEIKFEAALSFFEAQGCAFATHCGDITNTGFYNDGDTVNIDDAQMAKYKEICDAHPHLSVYGVCGNHESYVVPITNNLTELQAYTGNGLYFSIAQGGDLSIFLGQPIGNKPMGDDALVWLETTLTANKDKRCFVFVHPHIGSGNPLGAYTSNPIFDWWGNAKTNRFETALRNHGNAILFHGHTHVKFETQEQDDIAIYAWTGYHSVHVPSLGVPRDVVDGKLVGRNAESYCYIVDVYADGIHLRGYDVINKAFVPIGTYWLKTKEA